MSEIICECGDPKFGHVGRPNCVITQKTLAFPMFVPRINSNGNRNFLPANAAGITAYNLEYGTAHTTLAEVIDSLTTVANPLDRAYPGLRVENATFPRTDTVFETAPSGRKIKVAGAGGVRSWLMELWGSDAAHGVLRAYSEFGCSDLDVYYIDVTGNLWGIQDDPTSGIVRGYEMDTESFDSFLQYATDTTSQKINLAWDLDALECEQNAWVITSAEYGKKFTSITPLIQADSGADNTSTTVIEAKIWEGFGTAGNKGDIVGLTTASFIVADSTGTPFPHVAATTYVVDANGFGTYTMTMDAVMAVGDWTVDTTAPGYDVPTANFTV